MGRIIVGPDIEEKEREGERESERPVKPANQIVGYWGLPVEVS